HRDSGETRTRDLRFRRATLWFHLSYGVIFNRADGRTRTRIDLFRRQAPKSIQPRPQAAKPGVEPGISRVKAERVASYTTSQWWWLGPDSNPLPLELHTSALPNELPNRNSRIEG